MLPPTPRNCLLQGLNTDPFNQGCPLAVAEPPLGLRLEINWRLHWKVLHAKCVLSHLGPSPIFLPPFSKPIFCFYTDKGDESENWKHLLSNDHFLTPKGWTTKINILSRQKFLFLLFLWKYITRHLEAGEKQRYSLRSRRLKEGTHFSTDSQRQFF